MHICMCMHAHRHTQEWVHPKKTQQYNPHQRTLNLVKFFILQASSRLTAASIVLLGLSSLFNDVAFYFVVLIFFLQRGPIAPLSEEITDPENNYIALGVGVLVFGLLVYLPYPFPFSSEALVSF